MNTEKVQSITSAVLKSSISLCLRYAEHGKIKVANYNEPEETFKQYLKIRAVGRDDSRTPKLTD